MNAIIRNIEEKRLIGMSVSMSLTKNRTEELFKSFMPRRREIGKADMERVFDLRVYEASYFDQFDPGTPFTKWALVEALKETSTPDGMQTFILPAGKYALFHHTGRYTDTRIFQTIFTEWLPNSGHSLDNRPHFEIMTVGKGPNDPDAEQEIWIPIK